MNSYKKKLKENFDLVLNHLEYIFYSFENETYNGDKKVFHSLTSNHLIGIFQIKFNFYFSFSTFIFCFCWFVFIKENLVYLIRYLNILSYKKMLCF